MAETILTNVLNEKISLDKLFQWLTSENLEETICPEVVQNGSTRADFVSYFLNYLREQTKRLTWKHSSYAACQTAQKLESSHSLVILDGDPSFCAASQETILPESKEVQEKSSKKTSSVPLKAAAANSKDNGTRKSPSYSSYVPPHECVKKPAANYNNAPNFGQPVCHSGTPPTFGAPSGPMPVYCPQAAGPVPMGHYPPFSYQLNSSSPLPNSLGYPMTATIPNYNQGAPRHPQNQMRASPSSTNRSPVFPETGNSGDAKFPSGASSPYSSPGVNYAGFNPAVNQAQMHLANLNLTSSSGAFDNSFSNVSAETGSPLRYDNSIRNESGVPFSPLSPLYANNVSTLCPKRSERRNSEAASCHDYSINSANQSRSSTPKNAPGSGQKIVAKPPQNHNRSLADFIPVEGSKSSKKNLKKESKSQQGRKAEANSPVGGKKSPASGAKSKRRINPTRLDVSDGKASPGQEVFGVISRPTAANPKFVEAPSTDKSRGESSFEVERGLLKLERQRQPKSESAPESAIAERKLPSKSNLESAVVPSMRLVNNSGILETLAALYSGIFERNLMTNPMTELYFLITLLTAQYKTVDNEKSTKSDANCEKSPSSVHSLEGLDDDLGCTELRDDTSTEIDRKSSLDSNGALRKNLTNDGTLESSTLSDSTSTPEKRSNKRTSIIAKKYLGTAHNCVYFAVTVMMKLCDLFETLEYLDRATLKLLSENHQLLAFGHELPTFIRNAYEHRCLETKSIKRTDSRSLQTNVCFQVDTDNRETFPSPTAFSSFRKQRDFFYDILRDWEDNHLKPGWTFQQALRNKINILLTLHTDAVNYCHFAKLFVSQLLVSSVQSGQTEDPMNDESLSFLKSLKHVNPEKLIQLKERLVTPLTSTGPVPKPAFPGVQEFYKKFITHASDRKFSVILETTFIREILKLNEAQFAGSEIEGTETTVDESTKQNFIVCVSSLRLLAKFTSFTMSLPFDTEASSAEWLVSQIELRERVLPALDLQGCLLDALTNGRLSLTVPWIVQYMSMLDTVAFRFPYYADIGEQLYCIYRISSEHHRRDWMSRETAMLLMFTIGWLFELPNFPRDLYAYWQMNFDVKKLRFSNRTDDGREKKRALGTVDQKSSKKFVKHHSPLDKLLIVDDRALYECCPFLAEFKVLLISGNAVLGNTNANRHITPVSSQLSQSTSGAKTKNLQMQLEEAFFHGQPSSIRKTADFVSERVASSCVKYVCNTIIPAAKQRHMEAFLKSKSSDIVMAVKYAKDDRENEEKPQRTPEEDSAKSKRQLRSEQMERDMQALATTIKEAVLKECEEKVCAMCEERATKSIESLLADDAFPSVKETCAAIARRMAMQRIDEWIVLHITEALFLKNMVTELRKVLKEGDVSQAEKENPHNPRAPCPTETIVMLRNFMWELLEKKGRWSQLSVKYLKKMLTCLRQTLTERADLVDYPERNLYAMSVDLCLLLLTNRPELFTAEIQRQFISVWKMNNASRTGDTETLFVGLISPRNIRLLTDATYKTSFRGFAWLLKGLLKEDLMSIEDLSEQCVALFRHEWSNTVLKELSQCLNEIVADYKSSSAHAEVVKNLLVWIAATCDDMDICDYN